MILISQGNSFFAAAFRMNTTKSFVTFWKEEPKYPSKHRGANDYHDIYEFTYLYGAAGKWDCNSRPYLEQQEERSTVI